MKNHRYDGWVWVTWEFRAIRQARARAYLEEWIEGLS